MVVDYDVVSQGVPGLEGLVKEPMQVRTTSSSAADIMNIIDLKEVDEGGQPHPWGGELLRATRRQTRRAHDG